MWCSAVLVHISDFVPVSFHTLECMWHDEPASAIVHLAMKVAATPFGGADLLDAVLVERVVVGVERASAYVMLISCWPLPNSPFENSTGMPAPRIPLRIWRMIHSSLVVWSMW